MRLALLLAFLAAPAVAQDIPPELQALQTCLAGLDAEAIGVRAEAFTAEHDYEARLDALCEAGDLDEAAALEDEMMEAFIAEDPEAERMFACFEEAFGPDFDQADPCDD
jgi:pentatricopeptide repeat protein